MVIHLPTTGEENWGDTLNEYLSVSHDAEGRHKDVVNVRDFGAVGDAAHVDKVDHDDTADVSHLGLPGDFLAGDHVEAEGCVFVVGSLAEGSTVDVDDEHRFALIKDQATATGQIDAFAKEVVEGTFELVVVKDGALALVMFDARGLI